MRGSVLEPALRMYEGAGFVHHPAPRPARITRAPTST